MIKLKILLLLIFFPAFLFSQKTIILTIKSKTEIVNNISQTLLDNYVFPDTAIKMSNCILKKLKQGAYDKITDPVAFSTALNSDLYSVYHDGHMLVQFDPKELEPEPADISTNDQNREEDPFKKIKQANFGLKKVEILNGNIGYLRLDHFWADSIFGKETVKAALQFVSYTHALIVDLRDCGGGSEETVNTISGYFLEKPTHLNDMFDRRTNITTEYWTKPDTTFTKMEKMPLYILINNKTFSASEMFVYGMQTIHRAVIIGETTGGGAHGTFSQGVSNGFRLYVPYSTAISPITKTCWEQVGVKPDMETPSEKALETAEMKIFESMISYTKDSLELFNLTWEFDLLKAMNHPAFIDTSTLKKYAGVYGERTFTFEQGKLFYQRKGKPKFELEPMTSSIMKGKGNNYFKVEFVQDDQGKVDKVIVYYQDDRIESSTRTE
jgi:retinol-binding protein 3